MNGLKFEMLEWIIAGVMIEMELTAAQCDVTP